MKMRRACLILLATMVITPLSAADVGVNLSVVIDQPGLFGRVDIGNMPRPSLVYVRPLVIEPPPSTVVVPEPLYLHVPPGHARHWRKHCREYDACGRPVYFVQERWYNEVYVPTRRKHAGNHDEQGHQGHGRGKDHDRGHGHDDGDRN